MSHWPAPAEVLSQACDWAACQQREHPDLLALGVFGSYGRGDAGVGSDLDLVLILKECHEPIWERLRRWDTGNLPLALHSETRWLLGTAGSDRPQT